MLQLSIRGNLAGDFTVSWQAARALIEGLNPYVTIGPSGVYPFNAPFYYPLTAALAALPFAWLPPRLAGAAFFAAGSGLLAYALMPRESFRMPLFASSSFLVSAAVAQWNPLMIAAGLLPGLAWLLACKPNIGIPLFIARPSWMKAAGIAVFLLVSLLVRFDWVARWLGVVSSPSFHVAPVWIIPLGWLLLLAVVRIRHLGGRLLLLMALAPQSMWFHDQLSLWLLPRNRDESWLLTVSSWLAYGLYRLTAGWGSPASGAYHPGLIIVALIYLPALLIVLLPRPFVLRKTLERWNDRNRKIKKGSTWL